VLYCFPHLGGGPSSYRRLAVELSTEIEVRAVTLPGREHRIREDPLDNWAAVRDTLATSLAPTIERPYAVFGHSLGALLAFEFVRWCLAPTPAALLVAAHRAPQLPARRTLLDAEEPNLLRSGDALLGSAARMLAARGALSSLAPVLRADARLSDTYQFVPEPGLPAIPLHILGAMDDPLVDESSLRAWRVMGHLGENLWFDGGHMFVHRSRRAFAAALRTLLL
jgi:medium-chain acyl-[acyl-carrier-protein] hydrolase